MAINRKLTPGRLPDDFKSNFADTMYGSKVVSVRRTENPDYFLVLYNSNESDVGLGMVPEDQPVLTDGKGRKLAFDRLDGPQKNDSDHFYVLDDKVVVVSGVSAEERDKPHPVLEMERDAGLYKRILMVLSDDHPPVDLKKTELQGKPYLYEDALSSMLSSHKVSFEQLRNAHKECLIAHRLEMVGTNVTAVCENAAMELGLAEPFREATADFNSFFADLWEEGSISGAMLDYYFLKEEVSKNFPEVYKKVKDFALAEKGEAHARKNQKRDVIHKKSGKKGTGSPSM